MCCHFCGTEPVDGDIYCTECGYKLLPQVNSPVVPAVVSESPNPNWAEENRAAVDEYFDGFLKRVAQAHR